MGLNDVICPETPPAPHTAQILNLEEEKKQKGNSYQANVLGCGKAPKSGFHEWTD